MLVTIAWIVWIAIWGLIGYASVQTFLIRIEEKRATEFMIKMAEDRRKLEQFARTGTYNVIDINSIGVDINSNKKGL